MIQYHSESRPRTSLRKEREALLEGTYDPAGAKDMVADLLGSAIRFHKLKNLRSQVHAEAPDPDSVEQLARLERTLAEWKELLASAREDGSDVRVSTSIRLEIAPESGGMRRSVDWG